MSILNRDDKLVISQSALSISEILAKAPEEILPSILEADVVILPSHGSNDAFYTGTLDTFDYLKENGLSTEIFATDDEYKELSLHGADLWLGTFLVQSIVIPLFCNLIASYVYDKLKAKNDDNISVKFIIEDKEGKSTSVAFDGKSKNFPSVLDEIKKFSNEE